MNLLEQAQNYYNNNDHVSALYFAEQVHSTSKSIDEMLKAIEIISVSAFYADKKELGKEACECLAMDKHLPWETRNLAGQNSTYYASSSKDLMPSTQHQIVNFTPDNGWKCLNPSIVNNGDELWMIQRTVNYLIRENGSYDMQGDVAIRTNNYLMQLDNDLNILSSNLIKMPVDMPPPLYDQVLGFEDSRLFFLNNTPWCTSTVREMNKEGYCEIVIAKIEDDYHLSNYRVIHPQFGERTHQKNWMPIVTTLKVPPFPPDKVDFLYSSDPVRLINHYGNIVHEEPTSKATDSFRGGGCLLDFNDGWLGIIHESHNMPNHKRNYMHRFVFYKNSRLEKYTEAFYIKKLGIEFAAGLARNTNGDIIVSFGVDDRESWLAVFKESEILKCLK